MSPSTPLKAAGITTPTLSTFFPCAGAAGAPPSGMVLGNWTVVYRSLTTAALSPPPPASHNLLFHGAFKRAGLGSAGDVRVPGLPAVFASNPMSVSHAAPSSSIPSALLVWYGPHPPPLSSLSIMKATGAPLAPWTVTPTLAAS